MVSDTYRSPGCRGDRPHHCTGCPGCECHHAPRTPVSRMREAYELALAAKDPARLQRRRKRQQEQEEEA